MTNKFNIRQWAVEDRPRHKLDTLGAQALTNAELLSIIIGTGSREEDANIQQYTSNGGLAQKWIIRKNKDKTYTFINAWTGKAMQTNDKTEAGKKLSNKTNICQGKDDQGSNQKFLIR